MQKAKTAKHVHLCVALLLALILLPAARPGCQQITGQLSLANLGFAPERLVTDTAYTGTDFFWGGSLFLTQDVSDTFQIEAGVTRDLVMGNTAYSLFEINLGYVSMGLGTFLGFLNTPGLTTKQGVSTSARFEVPGIIFLSIRADGSPGGAISGVSDYSQEANEVALGVYVLNAICSVGMTSKRFTLFGVSPQILDSLTEYWLRVEAFQKNAPLRLRFLVSYQSLSREYRDGVTNPTDTLVSLLLGTGIEVDVTSRLALSVDMAASVYSAGGGQLAGLSFLGVERFLFKAYTGFKLNLEHS